MRTSITNLCIAPQIGLICILLPDMLDLYKGTIQRIVVPLKDNPAVLAYDVSNEPDLALSPVTPTQSTAWHTWLRRNTQPLNDCALHGASRILSVLMPPIIPSRMITTGKPPLSRQKTSWR